MQVTGSSSICEHVIFQKEKKHNTSATYFIICMSLDLIHLIFVVKQHISVNGSNNILYLID